MPKQNDTQWTYLAEQYFTLESLLRRYRHLVRRERRNAADPYRGQGRVLSLLKLQPEISQRELSYLLDMRNQSLGELLAKLENSGYITRAPSPLDRRVVDIRLTEAGRRAAEEMEAAQQGVEDPFDVLAEEEQQQLSALLSKLILALEKKLAEAAPEDGAPGDRRRGPGPRDWRYGPPHPFWEGGPGPGGPSGGETPFPPNWREFVPPAYRAHVERWFGPEAQAPGEEDAE